VQIVAPTTVELIKTYLRGRVRGRAQGKGEDKGEKEITRKKKEITFPAICDGSRAGI
jgi:hypothetical protein